MCTAIGGEKPTAVHTSTEREEKKQGFFANDQLPQSTCTHASNYPQLGSTLIIEIAQEMFVENLYIYIYIYAYMCVRVNACMHAYYLLKTSYLKVGRTAEWIATSIYHICMHTPDVHNHVKLQARISDARLDCVVVILRSVFRERCGLPRGNLCFKRELSLPEWSATRLKKCLNPNSPAVRTTQPAPQRQTRQLFGQHSQRPKDKKQPLTPFGRAIHCP